MADHPSSPSWFDPESLNDLHHLEWVARQIIDGLMAGTHHHPGRGSSIDFAEHRPYTAGDDTRHLDWKVFGRSDKFYLKQYEAETNLTVQLILDLTPSMTYPPTDPARPTKHQYARLLTASLAYLLLYQSHHVGMILLHSDKPDWHEPRSGLASLHRLFQSLLEENQPTAGDHSPSIARWLDDLAWQLPTRQVLVIITDAFDDLEKLEHALRHFRHDQHDVLLFQILDQDELEFPFDDETRLLGLEGESPLDVDGFQLRSAYQQEFSTFLSSLETACRSLHIDYQRAITHEPLAQRLHRFLRERPQRTW